MIATLWHGNGAKTNNARKAFVELCKEQNCNFEGGFLQTANHPEYESFKHLIFTQFVPVEAYVLKTRQSAFVFNTPAVHDCHGWKLGEYLAMGKAIISTPISNKLPAHLEHGKHMHLITNQEELHSGILKLSQEADYRLQLSQNVTSYFEEFVSPAAVIGLIMKKVQSFQESAAG